MTRKERLEFCKVCQKKNFDAKRGIVCSLTNEYADFEAECANFELDEKIKALDSFKKDIEDSKKQKRIKTKVKQKKIRVKEQFTVNDWLLLAGFALLATFIIRLIFYANFTYRGSGLSLHFVLVVLVACIMAVFFRKSQQDRNWFFSDIKFKLLLSSSIPILNFIYIWIIFGSNGNLLRQFIILVTLSIIISVISAIVIIPIHNIIKKFINE